MSSVTLDTGALIALERRRPRMWKVLQRARELGVVPVVPADVIAEWWRGRSDIREHILATTVDAIVMASAAQRGDAVYTSDVADLERLRAFFPPVRVFAA